MPKKQKTIVIDYDLESDEERKNDQATVIPEVFSIISDPNQTKLSRDGGSQLPPKERLDDSDGGDPKLETEPSKTITKFKLTPRLKGKIE